MKEVKVVEKIKEITVTFDPAQVAMQEVRRVIEEENEKMAKEGEVPPNNPLSL